MEPHVVQGLINLTCRLIVKGILVYTYRVWVSFLFTRRAFGVSLTKADVVCLLSRFVCMYVWSVGEVFVSIPVLYPPLYVYNKGVMRELRGGGWVYALLALENI